MTRKHVQELAESAMRCSHDRSELQMLLWDILRFHGIKVRGENPKRADFVQIGLLPPEKNQDTVTLTVKEEN
jgi:hypothetical protein